MPATVLENIKGSDLPRAWLSRMKIDPQQTFTVTLEPEEDMPPEDEISENLIKAVEASEKSLKAGRYTDCKTKKESDAFFEEIWND